MYIAFYVKYEQMQAMMKETNGLDRFFSPDV